jgi:cell division protein FtsA
LTEYQTGLSARIGLPNEHLAGDDLDELSKPMYSTCIGLILKGFNDYENRHQTEEVVNRLRSSIPSTSVEQEREILQELSHVVAEPAPMRETVVPETVEVEPRKIKIKQFLDSIKNNIIDLFKEEEDAKL